MKEQSADFDKLDLIIKNLSTIDAKMVKDSFELACSIHGDKKRSTGLFIEHALETAKIIADWLPNGEMISSALLHDTLDPKNTVKKINKTEIENLVGKRAAQIISEVYRLGLIQQKNLFLATYAGDDVSLIFNKNLYALLIKLASGMDTAQRLATIDDKKNIQKHGKDLLSRHASLAAQLGMWDYKRKMEDACLKAMSPEEFQELEYHQTTIIEKYADRIKEIQTDVYRQCEVKGIRIFVECHSKHIYSLYQSVFPKWGNAKQSTKSILPIEQLIRLSILTEKKDDCYRTLGCVHSIADPVNDVVRDYIASPKPNGYAEIRTAILVPFGANYTKLRVNISTQATQNIRDNGILSIPDLINPSSTSVEMMERFSEEDGSRDCVKVILNSLSQRNQGSQASHIRTYTPQGRCVDLRSGASPLDFAFAVHTELGYKYD